MHVKITFSAAGRLFIWKLFVILICHKSAGTAASESEYFSSIAGLETLLKTEQTLLVDLKHYVETAKQNIEVLEKELIKIEMEHDLAAKDTENYLTNPVNVYKLIKRLYNDWQRYDEYFKKAKDSLQQIDVKKNLLEFPSHNDFEESALALVRLQKTYNLDVAQVADGVINGIKYGHDMSWSDCLLLGQQLINVKAYNQTKAWIKESARRFDFERSSSSDNTLDFMEKLGENLLKTGDTEMALKVFRAILVKDPLRLRTLSNIYDNTYILPDSYDEEREYHATNEFKLYEKVCRQEIVRSPSDERNLNCHYHRGQGNSFCLSPFRIEMINFDPYIILVHNILSEEQIEKIKELTLPNMQHSMVRDGEGGASKKRNYRISKNAWLTYDTHPYTMKLLRDLHYVTGLDTSFSEQLQVANYGLGGHYEPHVDFFLLSDVEQGGATAFPFLKIAIKPTKGTVLFWYNLHHSLDGDYRTKHAGCPVLKGSKWIANVWTHDRKQDVVRPCGLYRDHEKSLAYEIVK